MINTKYLENAVREEPEGLVCGFCGGINDFYDDIGFYYATAFGKKLTPVCSYCWSGGGVEEAHQSVYGIGER